MYSIIVIFNAVSKNIIESTEKDVLRENRSFSNQPGFVQDYYCRHYNFDRNCASAGKLDISYIHRLFLDFEVT